MAPASCPRNLRHKKPKNVSWGGFAHQIWQSCFIQMEFNQYGQANQSHGDPFWHIFFRVTQAPHRKLQPTQKVLCKSSLEVTTRKKTRTSNFCWCSKDRVSASKILQVLWPLRKEYKEYFAEIADEMSFKNHLKRNPRKQCFQDVFAL